MQEKCVDAREVLTTYDTSFWRLFFTANIFFSIRNDNQNKT